ncbi:Protein ENHANCED DISEASE RESISTANCE 2 [Glycine max]|nr:Protein ENHANCED DISEASE RESISTANCE 2 [Glycine max]
MEASSSGEGSQRDEEKGMFQYFGWVYHIGVNSVGREYCHLRFLLVRGKCVAMYKRDPHQNPGIKPIRQGVMGATLVVEELGRRKVNNGELYVIQFCSRLDESRKGEIACATIEEAQRWMEAFNHAKQQAEHELSTESSARDKLIQEMEINLQGNRHKMKRYASGLRKLKKIGQVQMGLKTTMEMHLKPINGNVLVPCPNGKGVLVKSVGVIDATADSVFEVFLNTERQKRYEWHSKRDFVFSRQWFRAQDGTYTILQFPSIHKKKPPRSGYRRTKINPSTWEIRNLNTPMGSNRPRCLVTHTLEIHSQSWYRWKNNQQCTKFEKSIPYALLCQVAGLKEYIVANPALLQQYATTIHSQISNASMPNPEFVDAEIQDEFYDAISAESLSSDEESEEDKELDQGHKVKLKNVSWAMTTLALKRTTGLSKELDPDASSITIDVSGKFGSLCKGVDENDTNCWTSPSGEGFMIRGKNYLKDNSKVIGGDPLLKLIAVDWLKVDKSIDRIALHHRSLVQVPAKPNYSLVLYYASDRPVNKDSLLAKFLDGNDMFRDSRFKLIPSIVEGYWMVKRAVGTKACLLGKAVTCKYFKQDNFFEIDVDIGSSSVARSVIGLVLGYVTSLVVDLAILIEAKEEGELPEYLLGTVRLNRLKLESAVPLEA